MSFVKNKRFINNTGWMIGCRIVQMLLSFILTIFTSRYLGPSNYGIINYIQSFCIIFTPICTLGFNDIIVQELVEEEESEQKGCVLGTMMGFRLFSSFLSACAICLLSWKLSSYDTLYLQVALILSMVLIINATEPLTYWFHYRLESAKVSIIVVITYVCISVYRIIILFLQKDIRWFAAAFLLDAALSAGLTAGLYFKLRYPRMFFSFLRGSRFLKKSYHFILSGLMVGIYTVTDKIMLKQMMSEREVGIYSASLNLCQYWPFILSAIIESAKPLIMEEHKNNDPRYTESIRKLYSIIIWIAVFAAGGLTVFSPIIIDIVYGKEFSDSAAVLQVISWYTGFAYLGVARQIWLLGENKQRYEKIFSLFGVIVNIGLNIVLIQRYGAVGAAAATLLTQILINFVIPLIIPETRKNSILILEAFILKGFFKKTELEK